MSKSWMSVTSDNPHTVWVDVFIGDTRRRFTFDREQAKAFAKRIGEDRLGLELTDPQMVDRMAMGLLDWLAATEKEAD